MATNSKNGTIVGFMNSRTNGAWNTSDYVKTGVCNTGHISYYGVTVIKFTTPSLSGIINSLEFNLSMLGSTSTVGLRYAICTSDKNKDDYPSASASAVSDSTQIKSGVYTFSGLSTSSYATNSFSIDVDGLSSNATYYLYLWASTTDNKYIVIQATSGSVVAYYNDGLIHIDNGSAFDTYQVYIDNGTGWDMYQAYIDNGTGWDIAN